MCSKIVNNTRIAVNITKYLFFVTIIQCVQEYLAGAYGHWDVLRVLLYLLCVWMRTSSNTAMIFFSYLLSSLYSLSAVGSVRSVYIYIRLVHLIPFFFFRIQFRCSIENITNNVWIHKQSSGVTIFIVYLCINMFSASSSRSLARSPLLVLFSIVMNGRGTNMAKKRECERRATRARKKNTSLCIVANTKQIIENVALEKQFLAIGFWGLIII